MNGNVPKLKNEELFNFKSYVDVDLFEAVRLTNLFPEADSFEYLDFLFPEVFSDSKKMVAFKSSDDKFYLLEDKDTMGVIETEFIPIEYHSSYSLGLASKLKTLIEQTPDFFNEFLKDYDKIIIDSCSEPTERTLVVADYESLLPSYIDDLIKKIIFKNFDFDEQDRKKLLENISLYGSFNPDYLFRNEILKLEDDFNFILFMSRKKDWKNLHSFVSGEKSFDEIRNYYLYCIDLKKLNWTIDSFASLYPFIEKYIDIIRLSIVEKPEGMFKNTLNSIRVLASKNNNGNGSVDTSEDLYSNYDKNDLINLTRNVLKELDSTGKLYSSFDDALANGDIILSKENDEDDVQTQLVKLLSGLKNSDFSESWCLIQNNSRKINICLKDIVSDVMTLVHEFIHYYTKSDSKYTQELASIYFETKAGDILIESGFSEEQVQKFLKERYSTDGFNNVFSKLHRTIDLLHKKKTFGAITFENVRDESERESAKMTNLLLYNFFKHLEDINNLDEHYLTSFISTEEKSNYEYASVLSKTLSPSIKDCEKFVSYSVGSFLGRIRSKELDQIMFNYINHSDEISDDELFDSLTSFIDKKKINSSDGFQYSKKISDYNGTPIDTVEAN